MNLMMLMLFMQEMLLKLIDTSESPFFHGEVGDSLFIAKIKDKSGMLWVLVKM